MKHTKIPDLNNTLLKISSVYSSLTKSEQKVADVVMKEPEAAVFFTITDLSEKANVGETSVIRFCRKLGFRGYQEFKLSVAQNLSTPSQNIHGDIEDDDEMSIIVKKISAINVQNIHNTTTLLDEDSLRQAIAILREARKLYFFGVGSSGITAIDAKHRFMRIGYECAAENDAHIIAMNAALTKPGDVVIGISTSGSTKDLVDAMEIAKGRGANIICLTSHARSPITHFADVVLLTASKESPLQGGSFSSKLSQIHALDVLCTALAIGHKERTYESLERTAKAVLNKLY
ncbi:MULTISPECIES: MurR/RpiR family transcriptional regulator [Paenibacillus]|jgi:DNA-binding MurR/RpiR family transcriptional regulator|uniref:MurR/RpiR family transcriptional regulator n=1 Tax=Paenibacillus oceani TaxID=2772510 RepID=A0A927H380_9BACL|nr:MurR/RpiR family transcriptional regulator [Paenibacillus oceani]MBD2865204.1 MurR/RpiR family transcriptional regulator [Paenibacillus oceani]